MYRIGAQLTHISMIEMQFLASQIIREPVQVFLYSLSCSKRPKSHPKCPCNLPLRSQEMAESSDTCRNGPDGALPTEYPVKAHMWELSEPVQSSF
jgi:hypothetical protein